MRWDEEEHPRDKRGRFREKTGGWVEAVSDALGGAPGVRGRDLSDSAGVDWDGLAATVVSQSGDNFDETAPDEALGEIYRAQGYHGRPRIVTRAELDGLVAQGWTEVWRGHAGVSTTFEQARERAEQYRSSDRHYPGRGIYGNGSYFGPLETARRYAKFEPGDTWGDLSMEEMDEIFDDPHHPAWAGLTRAALPPDARIIDRWDAMQFYHDRVIGEAGLSPASHTRVLADLGRASALRGYDAIRVETGNGDEVYYVILNRSILAVQEA